MSLALLDVDGDSSMNEDEVFSYSALFDKSPIDLRLVRDVGDSYQFISDGEVKFFTGPDSSAVLWIGLPMEVWLLISC